MIVNLEYEKECSHCGGTGNDGPPRYDPCTWCNGLGFELTDEGKKLAAFMTKYFGIKAPKMMLKDKYDTRQVPNPLYED